MIYHVILYLLASIGQVTAQKKEVLFIQELYLYFSPKTFKFMNMYIEGWVSRSHFNDYIIRDYFDHTREREPSLDEEEEAKVPKKKTCTLESRLLMIRSFFTLRELDMKGHIVGLETNTLHLD